MTGTCTGLEEKRSNDHYKSFPSLTSLLRVSFSSTIQRLRSIWPYRKLETKAALKSTSFKVKTVSVMILNRASICSERGLRVGLLLYVWFCTRYWCISFVHVQKTFPLWRARTPRLRNVLIDTQRPSKTRPLATMSSTTALLSVWAARGLLECRKAMKLSNTRINQ